MNFLVPICFREFYLFTVFVYSLNQEKHKSFSFTADFVDRFYFFIVLKKDILLIKHFSNKHDTALSEFLNLKTETQTNKRFTGNKAALKSWR